MSKLFKTQSIELQFILFVLLIKQIRHLYFLLTTL
jgi:hypothetical protein